MRSRVSRFPKVPAVPEDPGEPEEPDVPEVPELETVFGVPGEPSEAGGFCCLPGIFVPCPKVLTDADEPGLTGKLGAGLLGVATVKGGLAFGGGPDGIVGSGLPNVCIGCAWPSMAWVGRRGWGLIGGSCGGLSDTLIGATGGGAGCFFLGNRDFKFKEDANFFRDPKVLRLNTATVGSE